MQKVILASGDKNFLERNTSLLMRRGLQLFRSTTGSEALGLHEEHHFDLIISDYKLEDMTGQEFCSLLFSKENVPVILACQNLPDSITQAEQSGASVILLKPIDPIQLLKSAGRFLEMELIRSNRVELKVKVLCKEQKLEFFCLSHDVSNTGILIETEHQLDLESRIICQFNLPPSSPIEAEGEIIRSMRAMNGKHLYGVRFVDIQMSHHRAILSYVNSIASSVTVRKQNID